MPAEWEPHAATWLAWPTDEGTWPGRVAAAGGTMARWVREIVRERPGVLPERAEILVQNAAQARRVRELLADWNIPGERVGLHTVPTNGSWVRDFGPTFVTRAKDPGDGLGRLAAVGWRFDAWGGKGARYYGARAGLDAKVPARIAQILSVPLLSPGVVLEGGAIEVNGRGTLLATTDCVLGRRDRPGKTPTARRRFMERVLADFLGVRHFLWLDPVRFEGDDTDGHVDNLARFVGPRTVLTVVATDRREPLFRPLLRNLAALARMCDQDGRPLQVVEVPLPQAQRFRTLRAGKRALWRYPASYANFYIANGCVLVPTFCDAADLPALEAIQAAFPDRAVIGADACDFILGQGAIHCSTQQQPRP